MITHRIIKLTNGETIIAEVAHSDENITAVIDPLQLDIGENPETGRPMLYALTWVPLSGNTTIVELKTNHVVAISTVDEDMDRYYRKSLAVMKNDFKTLKQIIEEEGEDESEVHLAETEDVDDGEDMWMKKFGKPTTMSANTVH